MIAFHLPFSVARAFRPAAFLLLAAALAGSAAAQLTRVSNTTLFGTGALPASVPTTGYALENAFPGVTFDYPLKAVTPPGETNRIFVVEKGGKIKVVNNLASPTSSVFLDLTNRTPVPPSTDPFNVYGPAPGNECGLLGLAFHPNYATNGQFYIFYSTKNSGGTLFQRVARFTVSANPNVANAASEQVLISQTDLAENHNGGDLSFGADGYLYISVGDGGNADDSLHNSQRIDKDFFSGILRVDVDRRADNLEPNTHAAIPINTTTGKANFKVPADNPWVGATTFNGLALTGTLRTEWYAVGLRNPYRFSFDPNNGRLYVGDVGQNTREEIDLVTKGGNYGWNYREGFIARPGSGAPPAGAVFIDPIIDYPRSDGFSVTGGLVYRGSRLPALYGQYVFADYGGNIWRLPLNETTGGAVSPTGKVSIATKSGIVGFGIDPRNGDVLLCFLATANASDPGRLLRLVASGAATVSYPATLSATGAFSSLATLTPNAGIVAYEPNVSFWSDYAVKSRWFSVPNASNTMTFNETGNWTFPTGTVWVKHFDLDLTRANPPNPPANRKRVETRFIVTTPSGIYGITYKWRDDQMDADLVPDAGDTKDFTVTEPGGAQRTQTWIYPSRTNCLNCHSQAAGYALSFNTPQLNRTNVFGSQTQNQIEALHGAGYLASPGSPSAVGYARYALASDATASLEWRVRSYLAVNCVSCHQPGGPAQGNWDARTILRTAQAGIIDGPLVNLLGDAANRVIVRGDTAHSMIHRRVSAAIGSGNHMPPIATNEINQEAVNLLTSWINGPATSYQTFPEWQQAKFGSTTAPNAQATADPDGDGSTNRFEFLLGTNPQSASEGWSYHVEPRTGSNIAIVFPRVANRRFRAFSSLDGQTWTLWNVPANVPNFSATSFVDEMVGPRDPSGKQFLRLEVDEP